MLDLISDISNNCAFTGHRPNKLPWGNNEQDERCLRLKEILQAEIEKSIEAGYINFISGMTLGIDLIASEIVLELKKIFDINLICVVFYEKQYKNWSEEEQQRYFNILNQSDKKFVLAKDYSPECIDAGNKFLVQHSSLLIAVWNGNKSETANTIKIAEKENKQIRIINLNKFNI